MIEVRVQVARIKYMATSPLRGRSAAPSKFYPPCYSRPFLLFAPIYRCSLLGRPPVPLPRHHASADAHMRVRGAWRKNPKKKFESGRSFFASLSGCGVVRGAAGGLAIPTRDKIPSPLTGSSTRFFDPPKVAAAYMENPVLPVGTAAPKCGTTPEQRFFSHL
jgi:hypothetical protein